MLPNKQIRRPLVTEVVTGFGYGYVGIGSICATYTLIRNHKINLKNKRFLKEFIPTTAKSGLDIIIWPVYPVFGICMAGIALTAAGLI